MAGLLGRNLVKPRDGLVPESCEASSLDSTFEEEPISNPSEFSLPSCFSADFFVLIDSECPQQRYRAFHSWHFGGDHQRSVSSSVETSASSMRNSYRNRHSLGSDLRSDKAYPLPPRGIALTWEVLGQIRFKRRLFPKAQLRSSLGRSNCRLDHRVISWKIRCKHLLE